MKKENDGWVSLDDDRFWEILYEEARINGGQIRRIYVRLKEISSESYCQEKERTMKKENNGWIPVDKENLPDYEVLACDKYGEEMLGYLSYDSDAEIVICDSDICLMNDVIAWMEKPEPYRPERSEE